jgi:NAD-dependent SIR2 family protein deacetylase
MVERTFAELVRDLRLRRTNGEHPPVLLLGAGASADAGIGAMDELYKFFGVKDFDGFAKFIGPTSPAERYRYLADFLQKRQPAQVTPGYQALATLCAQNCFDLVLSTNMDPLLDDALTAARRSGARIISSSSTASFVRID